MTDEQKAKIEKKIMLLSMGILGILIIALVVIGFAGLVETLIFPVLVAVFLTAYWIISDVLSVKWLHSFEGKTDDQKKSYYIYCGLDLIGLGGLVYFMVDMKSTTGAIIYICSIFLKRRFRDEFNGVKPDEEETENEEAEEAEVKETGAEITEVETAEEQEAEPENSETEAAENPEVK